MHGVAAGWADAVSVRYAREQYALGYVHGRSDDVASGDALAFARFYAERCDTAGKLVDVRRCYRRWSDGDRPAAQLALFG